ncbi:expressed unknown protein [Seminavis robusta]|uniref:Uncharacterized protein n=1 Tax=Seminavis robusta TaxID=568900 RepID=A0A9N8F090_9STRA|nr:expressed unknown protein [Seminavis robusta]|eukprot:Sro2413_g326760.1 n/a (401) ;mRNA; f:6635-7837
MPIKRKKKRRTMRSSRGLLLVPVGFCALFLLERAHGAAAAAVAEDVISHPHENGSIGHVESDDDEHAHETSTVELEEDDRSWLDVFGEVSKEYLTTQMIPPTDASCVWDWRVARCEPFCQCAFLPSWGDYHLGRSCRYRPNSNSPEECNLSSQLTFDHLRLEYSLEEQQQQQDDATMTKQGNNSDTPALKQLLFQTVKAIQTIRDYLQKWTLKIKQNTQHHYEHLQEQTCADLATFIMEESDASTNNSSSSNTCVPPADLSWKQALLCQGWEAVCEQQDTATSRQFPWQIPQSWKELWDKIKPKDEAEEEESNDIPQEFSSLLPNWSTASDWSAGIAMPKPQPQKPRRKPRIGKTILSNTADREGFAGISNTNSMQAPPVGGTSAAEESEDEMQMDSTAH